MKIVLALLVSASMMAPATVPTTAVSEVVFIANHEVNEESLSQGDIKNIFLGKKSSWSDGSRISFAVLDGGELHRTFLQRWVKRSPSQYTMYWRRMVFTGRAKSLKVFEKETELMAYVANTDGAIAYVGPDLDLADVKLIMTHND